MSWLIDVRIQRFSVLGTTFSYKNISNTKCQNENEGRMERICNKFKLPLITGETGTKLSIGEAKTHKLHECA